MVKLEGKRKTHKVCRPKTRKFYEIREEIEKSRGGNAHFSKIGEEMYCLAKMRK